MATITRRVRVSSLSRYEDPVQEDRDKTREEGDREEAAPTVRYKVCLESLNREEDNYISLTIDETTSKEWSLGDELSITIAG